ncbi:hypothetical protein ESCO_000239 [Escovopsis weberi]|uniref:Uncharacterized protein n=1 Tax=Escovopsis weberi TaxID=150374 RepID=A0A0M8MVL1_ESCWE|nr:hypothetical protein ESCO_000239 [Escovopsis weberi]
MAETAAMSPFVRGLRLVSITTWVPSLALSIAHGFLSRQPYPSTGIVPHTVSAILAICVLRLPCEPDSEEDHADSDAESATLEAVQRPSSLARILHPFVVFLLDVAICAAFAWILVQTWLQDSPSNHLAMLAAYTTVPQMANFLANAGSGLHSIYYASLPEVPWLKRSKRREFIAPVLVDEEQRYRDESDADESRDSEDRQPGAASVQNDSASKGKSGPFASTTDLPWGRSAGGSY